MVALPTTPVRPIPGRAGPDRYVRCSTVRQDLQIQIDDLGHARCKRITSEKFSSQLNTVTPPVN
jgi:hypothetical protein